MKLQTMLLPTGEFALIATNIATTDQAALERIADSLSAFRKATGAVAGLMSDGDIEVVDALVDENAMAVRMDDYQADEGWMTQDDDFDEDDLQAGYRSAFGPELTVVPDPPADHVSAAKDSVSGQIEVHLHSAVDPKMLELIYGESSQDLDWETATAKQFNAGATVSPAGLVVGGERTLENDTVLSGTANGGEPGAQPVVDVVVGSDDGWRPRAGDTVLITGPTYYNSTEAIGRTGMIIENRLNNTPDEHELVEVPDLENENDSLHLFVSWDSMEVQPAELVAEPWEPTIGTRVKVVRINGWKAVSTYPNPFVGETGWVKDILPPTASDDGKDTVYVVHLDNSYKGSTDVNAVEVEPAPRAELEDHGYDDDDYDEMGQ